MQNASFLAIPQSLSNLNDNLPMPSFSVILSNFNGEGFLSQAIESVTKQSFDSFEFILIDDGSTDSSLSIMEEYASENPMKIRVIKMIHNRGQAEAINAGIAASKGRYIALIDADDIWYPSKLEETHHEFEANPAAAFHQHPLHLIKNGVLTDEPYHHALVSGNLYQDALSFRKIHRFTPTSGLTFQKSTLDSIGLIPREFRVCADGFLTRTGLCFGPVILSNKALGAYRVHEKNNTFENPGFDGTAYLRSLLIPQINSFYERKGLPLRFPIPAGQKTEDKLWSFDCLQLKDNQRILVVRSAPVDQIGKVLRALFDCAPNLTVDLLVQPGYETPFDDPRINTLPLNPGPIGQHSLDMATSELLKTRHYHLALIPYATQDEQSYQNIHSLLDSLNLKAPQTGITHNGNICPWTKKRSLVPSTSNRFDSVPSWIQLQNIHMGKRAFVIGNGPSLRLTDLDRLTDEISFASNKIYLAYPSVNWRPTYYTVCDQMVAANNAEVIRSLPDLMLMPSSLRKFNCGGIRTVWYEEKCDNALLSSLSGADLESKGMLFNGDIRDGVQGGYTVLYHQLQLAFFMGIREVYLMGVDFSFTVPESRTVDDRFTSDVYRNAIVSSGEINHFHPDYRKPGETWTMPRLDLQRCAFRSALEHFENAGGKLINVSRSSKLDVFPKSDFDLLFHS